MKGKWKRILICSILVISIIASLFVFSAFADPFTSVAIGGLTGLSGAGLFGSMASAAGLDINYISDPVNDAMWNNLNPDSIYFSGNTGTETVTDPQTQIPTVYDYITLDASGLHDAMLDNISAFITENSVTDNDTGTVTTPASWFGVTLDSSLNGVIGSVSGTGTFNLSGFTVVVTPSGWGPVYFSGSAPDGTTCGSNYAWYVDTELGGWPVQISVHVMPDNNGARFYYTSGAVISGTSGLSSETVVTSQTIGYTSGTLNTGVFDGYTAGAKMSIPRSVSGLTDGFNYGQFIGAINQAWDDGNENTIIWGDAQPQPTPTPTPYPDTNLGDIPFVDWMDLFGQSVIDAYTRQEQQLQTIDTNLEDIFDETHGINEGVSDIQSLFDDLNIKLDDIDDYFQQYGTDVLDDLDDLKGDVGDVKTDVGYLHENVEDIEDEVIIIVDEMGNVLDVLEGIEAQEYANGQSLGSISSGVTSIGTAMGRVSTSEKQDEQTDILEDVQEAVEDIVPYVVPIPKTYNYVIILFTRPATANRMKTPVK